MADGLARLDGRVSNVVPTTGLEPAIFRLEVKRVTTTPISLSLDVWTSKNAKAMLGVIGHWITPDFVYRERVLEFIEIEGPHTGENMADTVYPTLMELSLETKLFAVTADNAANNDTLVNTKPDTNSESSTGSASGATSLIAPSFCKTKQRPSQ